VVTGVLDFAGGVPVETASGFSALAAALAVGARRDYGRLALLPHNTVLVPLGAGLLWFGWFGFNGGSGLSTGHSSVLAFTNTLLAPACALVVWFVLDLLRNRQVTAIGAATAIIATRPPGAKARNPRIALLRGFPPSPDPGRWLPHATAVPSTAVAITTAVASSHMPLQCAS